MKRERTSAPFKKEHSGPEAANKNDRAAARLVDAIEDGNPFDVD